MKKYHFIYIGIILLLIYGLFFNNKPIEKTVKDIITVDSTKVEKIIPKKTGVFKNETPTETITIIKESPEKDAYILQLLEDLNTLKTDAQKNTKLLKELKTREYKKTYEDSSIVITVRDTVNGRLRNQYVNWTFKEQKQTYYEKTITEKLIPKHAVFVGGSINTSSSFEDASFGLNINYQNEKGSQLGFGYNTNNQWSIDYKKRLFIKYKKNKSILF